jgi:hypothetical protein
MSGTRSLGRSRSPSHACASRSPSEWALDSTEGFVRANVGTSSYKDQCRDAEHLPFLLVTSRAGHRCRRFLHLAGRRSGRPCRLEKLQRCVQRFPLRGRNHLFPAIETLAMRFRFEVVRGHPRDSFGPFGRTATVAVSHHGCRAAWSAALVVEAHCMAGRRQCAPRDSDHAR